MRNAMRISLVMLLFVLAVWSAATAKAGGQAGGFQPPRASAMPVRVAHVAVDAPSVAVDATGAVRATAIGAISALNADPIATGADRFASVINAAAPFSLHRL